MASQLCPVRCRTTEPVPQAMGDPGQNRRQGARLMPRYAALPPNLAPRGLCREAAAEYIGVSAGTFDELVRDGRMPGPKRINARKVWDVRKLDIAFAALPADGDANPWDEVLNRGP